MGIESILANCQHCAECCKRSDVLVTSEEAQLIAVKTRKKLDEFAMRHFPIANAYVLKHQQDGDCTFLGIDGEKYACGIYSILPDTCSTFPSNNRDLNFCETQGKLDCE